jgi:L-threonylcarbamoyladenylate synthase
LPLPPSSLSLQAAYGALNQGEVIACPTEAVWGLTCDPDNPEAVAHLLILKQRPVAKGLILVAANLDQIDFLLSDLEEQHLQTLSTSWPGPVTWLLPHKDRVPSWICGDHNTVAVRVSDHPVVSTLCTAWGGPLVSTSANPGGAQPAREAYQVRRYFGQSLGYVMPGRTGSGGRPTSIRDLISGQFIRQ